MNDRQKYRRLCVGLSVVLAAGMLSACGSAQELEPETSIQESERAESAVIAETDEVLEDDILPTQEAEVANVPEEFADESEGEPGEWDETNEFVTDTAYFKYWLEDTPAIGGIAYLGNMWEFDSIEGYVGSVDGLSEYFAIVDEIPADHIVSLDGTEIYLIVPRDEDAWVTIRDWVVDESNDYTGETGELRYESRDGQPILVMGNESDIVPNFSLMIQTSDGDEIDFQPFLSGENGRLNTEDISVIQTGSEESQLWDLSWYEGVRYGKEGAALYNSLLGTWTASVDGTDGRNYDLALELSYDGSASLSYTVDHKASLGALYNGYWEILTDPSGNNVSGNGNLGLSLTRNEEYTNDTKAPQDIFGNYEATMVMDLEEWGFTLVPTDEVYLTPNPDKRAFEEGIFFSWSDAVG